jgi:hypothetical protein
MMVLNEWQNGILVTFIASGKAREIDLHPIMHALSQCLLKD